MSCSKTLPVTSLQTLIGRQSWAPYWILKWKETSSVYSEPSGNQYEDSFVFLANAGSWSLCVCVCLWNELQPISGKSLIFNVRSAFIIISQWRNNCRLHRSLVGTSILYGYVHPELPLLWSCPCLYPSSPALRCSHQERHLPIWGSSPQHLILDPIPSSLLRGYSVDYPCLVFSFPFFF